MRSGSMGLAGLSGLEPQKNPKKNLPCFPRPECAPESQKSLLCSDSSEIPEGTLQVLGLDLGVLGPEAPRDSWRTFFGLFQGWAWVERGRWQIKQLIHVLLSSPKLLLVHGWFFFAAVTMSGLEMKLPSLMSRSAFEDASVTIQKNSRRLWLFLGPFREFNSVVEETPKISRHSGNFIPDRRML